VMMRGISSPELLPDTMRGNTAGARAAAATMPTPAKVGIGSTTMRGSSGERHAPTVKTKSSRGWLIGAVVLVGLLAGGGWLAMKKGGAAGLGGTMKGRADDPTHPAGAGTNSSDDPAAATIQLNIDSEPSGAMVTDLGAGTSLGTTPLMMVRPSSDKLLTVRVAKSGFVPSTLTLNLARDTREMVSLAAVATPPEAHEQPAAHPLKAAERPKHAPEHSQKDHPHHPAVHEEEEPAKL